MSLPQQTDKKKN